jgi:hypothetical protein
VNSRIDRLEKLAAHLEAGCPGGHETFTFWLYSSAGRPGCGTSGCAAGELPFLFPDDWKFHDWDIPALVDRDADTFDSLRSFFGFEEDNQVRCLFYGGCERIQYGAAQRQPENATRDQVAANIRAFIEWAKQDVPA